MGLGLADREDHGHDHPDQADHEDAVDRPVLTRAEEPLLRSLRRLIRPRRLARFPSHARSLTPAFRRES